MNVLVVVLDTVRPDTLGCNGGRAQTPSIDRLVSEGALLTNAYSEFPVTVPTRHALVAGIYTWTNRPWSSLRPYDLHIAEVFRDSGYDTVAFSDTPFNPGPRLDRGFNEFNTFPGKLQPPPPEERPENPDLRGAAFPEHGEADIKHWTSFVTGYDDFYRRKHGGRIGMELLVDEASTWLASHDRSQPFFMWIDCFQPHEPWSPPAPYDKMYQPPDYKGRFLPLPTGPYTDWLSSEELDHIVGLYEGEVTATDVHFGRLLDQLDALDLTEDTVVVLVSDHGQPFGEHGTIRKFGVPLYDELSKIVWTMRKPGLIPAGVRRDGFGQTPDLLPTLAEIAGIELQPQKMWYGPGELTGMDGVSLVPLVMQGEPARDRVWLGAFAIRSGVRRGNHKFIDNRGEKPNELFDLAADPLEKDNLLTKEPDLAAELHREIFDFTGRWSAVLAWRDDPAKVAD